MRHYLASSALLLLLSTAPATAREVPEFDGVNLIVSGQLLRLKPLSAERRTAYQYEPPLDAIGALVGGRVDVSQFDFNNLANVPVVPEEDIEALAIRGREANISFISHLVFMDEYLTGNKVKYELYDPEDTKNQRLVAISRWGKTTELFAVRHIDQLDSLYLPSRNNSFGNETSGYVSGDEKIGVSAIGKLLLTNIGAFAFMTVDNLNNLLWSIYINDRYSSFPEFDELRSKLERMAYKPYHWGTVAWLYKKFGDKDKAVSIYATKVIAELRQTETGEALERWEKYYKAIQE